MSESQLGALEQALAAAARAEAEVTSLRAQLADSQKLTERIVAHAPIGVGYMDRNLVFRWVNPSLANFLGLELDAMIGAHVFALLPEAEPQFGPLMHQVLETGEPFSAKASPFVYELGGETRTTYWDFTYAPVLGSDGRALGILVVNIEVSERVQSLSMMAVQVDRLSEIDQLRTDFINVTSHELRTPLTTVMGYAEFLAEGVGGALPDEQTRFVAQIIKATDRMRRLVDDVLDVALIESGELSFEALPCDLVAVVRECVDSLQPQAQAAQVAIEATLPAEPLPVTIDPTRVGQAVLNLAANAIAVSTPGSRVQVRVEARGDQLRVEVQDEGPGLAPEIQSRVFEKFFRVKRAGARTMRGAGLGLAIAKAMVEAHAGAIGVDSDVGSGSTFWFTLPTGSATPG